MNYFISTGEASAELAAVRLAQAIRAYDPDARFEGIGASRMREAGFTMWLDHTGWASMGPFEAIPRIPKLALAGIQTARHLIKNEPHLVILIDFGAFHLGLAKMLRRRFHYSGPILDWFPPAAWLHYERTARTVADLAVPLPAFAHQYDLYKRLQLPVVYFGHPLVSQYTQRSARPAPSPQGGHIALLPGSRSSEIKRHLPVLLEAAHILKMRRPELRVTYGVPLREAIVDVDAAFVASGTAVLETVLSGVPTVALYILSPLLARYARRVYSGAYVTIPNLVMDRQIVPEFLQERATPENLANAMDELLKNPERQYEQFAGLRETLGPSNALERTAKFAVALATAGKTKR